MKVIKKILNFLLYPLYYAITAYRIMGLRRNAARKKKLAWVSFMLSHKDAVDGWYRLHGLDMKPPITYDKQTNRFRWINRESRRRIMRQLSKSKRV